MNILSKYRVLCILICALPCFSQANQKVTNSEAKHEYISHQMQGKTLAIKTKHGTIKLTALSQSAIEAVYQAKVTQLPATHLPSYALKEGLVTSTAQLIDETNTLSFSAGLLTAKIQKAPFLIRYYKSDKLLISENRGFFERTVKEEEAVTKIHGVNFTLAKNEQFIGGGQRVVGMNRRGQRFPLYNRAHYGYETHSLQMNYGIPAVVSNKKYLLLFDNSAKGWLDIGKTDTEVLQFEAVAGRNAYIIVAGDSYPQLINNYVDITGKQPLPPRWALGNFASRFGYRSQQEVLDTVDKFKQLDVPLDAVIIDLYWFGKDIQGHMGNLDWDKSSFPQPEKMISSLSKQDIKPILITEPFVLSSSTRWQEVVAQKVLAKGEDGSAKTFDFYFGNTGIVDVFNETGRNWFADIYEDLDNQGIKGWWGDLGEPEVHPSDAFHTLDDGSIVSADAIHNVYGHQWAKMLFQKLQKINPEERGFILMRSGFAGSQRYGMIPWTGDVNRTWGGLKPQVELSLQMSMLGLSYTHSDLGGFAGGEVFDKELYIRWLQYGVFQPVYRPHGQENIPSEVVFHDKQTLNIIRKFINLRYQLLPYNYTLAYQNALSGMPLMRPLFFDEKLENQHFTDDKSYMWGDSFLVRPIVNPGVKTITMALPQGVWFNYFSGQRYIGGSKYNIATSINDLPVFVKAGAFIPLAEKMSSTEDYNAGMLNLHYYADDSVQSASGQMFDDDGKSANTIENKAFELLSFNAVQKAQALTISLNSNGHHYDGKPEQRTVNLVIHNWDKKPETILANNKKVATYTWDETSRLLSLSILWQQHPMTIKIN